MKPLLRDGLEVYINPGVDKICRLIRERLSTNNGCAVQVRVKIKRNQEQLLSIVTQGFSPTVSTPDPTRVTKCPTPIEAGRGQEKAREGEKQRKEERKKEEKLPFTLDGWSRITSLASSMGDSGSMLPTPGGRMSTSSTSSLTFLRIRGCKRTAMSNNRGKIVADDEAQPILMVKETRFLREKKR